MTDHPSTAPSTYTFGDSERAAERLFCLARTFEASTLDFVREACSEPPRVCLDLGAGPGFLSNALHRTLSPERTVGLESSASFIAYGAPHLREGVSLQQHDVTHPLPLHAELLVARFLLTHLRDPESALRVWNASSASGTALLLEELVSMRGDSAELALYYELVATVQRAANQDMHIGARLPHLTKAAGFAVERASQVTLLLPLGQMARLHALNLPTLRQQPIVQSTYSEAQLDELQRWLGERAGRAGPERVRVTMARCAGRVT